MDATTKRRLLNKIAMLDRLWRQQGCQEGKIENRLAFELGNAARAGLHDKSRKVQIRSARRLGQRSGWEEMYA